MDSASVFGNDTTVNNSYLKDSKIRQNMFCNYGWRYWWHRADNSSYRIMVQFVKYGSLGVG